MILPRRLKIINRMLPGLIVSTTVVGLLYLGAIAPLEQMVSNQFMRWRGERSWDERLVMVSVDDASLRQLGQFPISRNYYAQLLTRLDEENASVVVFNIMLSDETVSPDGDTTTDALVARTQNEASRSATGRLARAMASHERVVIGKTWDKNWQEIAPVPVLENTALAVGHLRLKADRDGFTRAAEVSVEGIPAMGVAAIQAYSLEAGPIMIPSEQADIRINWPSSVDNVSTLSLIDVLQGGYAADALTDKIVFVGYGATSGYAPMRTPFDQDWPVPAGYMHLAIADNLLNQNWLQPIPFRLFVGLLLIVGPLFSSWLYRRETWKQVMAMILLGAGWIALGVIAMKANFFLPVIAPLLAVLGTGASVVVWGRLQSNALLQVRSAFLSTMSHEIRTPLNAIVNLSEMLRETPLNVRQREYADTLVNSSQTLVALINDVLDFSKIESGQLMLEAYPVTLTETIERSIELLAPRAAEKQIELVYSVSPNVPPMVLGDPVRLQQVLINLLSNAVKFTETGEVAVRVQAKPAGMNQPIFSKRLDWLKQQFGIRTQSRYRTRRIDSNLYEVRFAVRDTGIGIPADRVPQLFKPFSQVSASTTRKYGGTGLGLSISKRLSERMGGDLWVTSSLGRGSTFYFTFKARRVEGQPSQPDYLDAIRGLNLLLIDRNQTRREQTMRLLQSIDSEVLQATSLSEAMTFLQSESRFDGVILDEAVALNAGDVESAIAQLRATTRHQNLPIILLSALQSSHTPLPAVGQNVTAVWKPVKQTALLQSLLSVRPMTVVKSSVRSSVLPEANAAQSAARFLDRRVADTLPLSILVADDNRINQRVALRLLELMGYAADVVSSGKEAIAAVEQTFYDVVLMDMRMPDMDGLEATRRLRQNPRFQSLWIVAMTANATAKDRKRCYAAGMNDYISKPIQRDALEESLRQCFEEKTGSGQRRLS